MIVKKWDRISKERMWKKKKIMIMTMIIIIIIRIRIIRIIIIKMEIGYSSSKSMFFLVFLACTLLLILISFLYRSQRTMASGKNLFSNFLCKNIFFFLISLNHRPLFFTKDLFSILWTLQFLFLVSFF